MPHIDRRKLSLSLERLEARETPAFPALQLGALGSGGATLKGWETGAQAGHSVSGVGDVNGDGFDDVVVGTLYADGTAADAGEAYVVFGAPNLAGGSLSLSPNQLGFTLAGFEASAKAGASVAGLGDVNGDGYADLGIGAPDADAGGGVGADRGEVYVIFGGPNLAGSTVNLNNLTTGGFTVRGFEAGAHAGTGLAGAGDVNGDGFADVVVGANYAAAGGIGRGAAYVVFGGPSLAGTAVALNGAGVLALNGFEDGAQAGFQVAGAGDVNGDGFSDLAVGAPYADAGGTPGAGRGEVYVVFGSAALPGATLALNNLGTGGLTLRGGTNAGAAGRAVDFAGDVNNDGFTDILVGAPIVTGSRGEAYVVFGGSALAGTTKTLTSLGAGGFTLRGFENGQLAASAVSRAGDVNGDGYDDVLIGAPDTAAGGSKRGESYVVFGGRNLGSTLVNLNNLGAGGFAIRGFENGGQAGAAVDAAGDLNGDGLTDLILGAPGAAAIGPPGGNYGEAYIVFSPAASYYVAGAGQGMRPVVKVYDAVTGRKHFEFLAFDPTYTGGVNVAVGDVTGDGTADIITSMAAPVTPDVLSRVRVFDGKTFARIADFIPYDGFKSGMQVGAADVNGDGRADIIASPGPGGGPHIKVIDGTKLGNVNGNGVLIDNGSLLAQFFAYAQAFRGGVNMSVGDINNDGKPDIVTGVGSGGGPHVKVINGTKLGLVDGQFVVSDAALITSFFAYAPSFTGGVLQSVGDVNGDGTPDLITSAGPGGGPQVKVIDGTKLNQINGDGTISGGALVRTFLAYDAAFTGGARVAALDVDLDGRADIVTGAGAGGGPHVKVFRGADGKEIRGFMAFDPSFLGGVYVGAGRM